MADDVKQPLVNLKIHKFVRNWYIPQETMMTDFLAHGSQLNTLVIFS